MEERKGKGAPGRMGFSLLELIAALAILALLASVVTPVYTAYVERGHRASARADLLRCALGMERHASWTFGYEGALDTDGDGVGDADLGVVTPNLCAPSSTRHVVRLADVGPAHFLLQAAPVSPRPASDGVLGIDADGARWWDRNGDGDFEDSDEDHWEE